MPLSAAVMNLVNSRQGLRGINCRAEGGIAADAPNLYVLLKVVNASTLLELPPPNFSSILSILPQDHP